MREDLDDPNFIDKLSIVIKSNNKGKLEAPESTISKNRETIYDLARLNRDTSQKQIQNEANPVDQDMQDQDFANEQYDAVDELQNDNMTSVSQKLPSQIPTNVTGRTYISDLQK